MTLAEQVAKFEERGLGYMAVGKSTEWETPKALFDALDREFGPFTLDPCGQREHHYSAFTIHSRGGLFFDGSCPALDGRAQDWSGVVYMNPPYGRALPDWIAKAVHEVKEGHCDRVVALIPSRTDTASWQTHVIREAAFDRMAAPDYVSLVRFLGKTSPGMESCSRVRFGGVSAGAPFPCAVVVWEL